MLPAKSEWKIRSLKAANKESRQSSPVELTQSNEPPSELSSHFIDDPKPKTEVIEDTASQSLWHLILEDHRNFYDFDTLMPLTLGVAGASIAANTSMDRNFHDFFQENVRNADTDEWSEALHVQKFLGNGYVTLPIFAASVAAGTLFPECEPLGIASAWGERSIRSALVGAPPMLAMQHLTGGSRPGERPDASHWRPFQDDNGVSGHSFMGAIPFLTAAKMTDNPWVKNSLYFGSTLAGLSRINDDGHFLSQAFLGWWFAFLAVEAVDQTEDQDHTWRLVPLPAPDAQGMAIERRW